MKNSIILGITLLMLCLLPSKSVAPTGVPVEHLVTTETYPVSLHFQDILVDSLDSCMDVPLVEDSTSLYYNVPLSDELQIYTQELCFALGVSYPLVLAIMDIESRFQGNIVSPLNSNGTQDYGLMQINSGNFLWLSEELGVSDFLEPYQNIYCGVYILSLFSYLEDPQIIAMYYNSGMGQGKKNVQKGIFTLYSTLVVEKIEEIEGRVRE